MEETFDGVLLEKREDGIGILTLNRPEKLNSIGAEVSSGRGAPARYIDPVTRTTSRGRKARRAAGR